MDFLEKQFHLKENHTHWKIEVYAGVTTFMTMAYILVVNPSILSATGMDSGAVLTATAIASALATFCMAFFSNYPFALAPGMGLNAYFAYTIVLQMHYSWQMALVAVFAEGIVFILLSLFHIREMIFDSIPKNLKLSVSVGIGMFIAFIGLQNAGIVKGDPNTLVALGNMKEIPVFLALLGTGITVLLTIKQVKGSLLWGILITYFLGLFCQFAGLYPVAAENGLPSLLPDGLLSLPPSLSPVFLQLDFSGFLSLDFLVIVFSLLFVDLFNTLGTLIGVATKADFLDSHGKLPKIKGALLADAVGTTAGAMLGTSTVTTFVESAAGVAAGGRTGLSAFVTGLLFLVALIFTPVLTVIPSFATAPALIVVGLFMMEQVTELDFKDYTEGFPAFFTILMMVATYSIAEGLVFGILSYVFLKLLCGKYKELNPFILASALLFFLRFLLL